MAAYFIVDVDIQDMEGMREYIERVPSIVRKFGGRYLVRGGKHEVLEGDWEPARIVVLEFPSMEQAKLFYDSSDYKEFKEVRLRATKSNGILVEGI
jgi:uncharacterized protein (DUF1330 family)